MMDVRPWRAATGRTARVQRFGEASDQTLCGGVLERAAVEAAHIEHILGPLADGHDLRADEVDALLHEHLADIAEQSRSVAGDELEDGATVAFVARHRQPGAGVEHPRLARRAA
jgi:hypothetical protein